MTDNLKEHLSLLYYDYLEKYDDIQHPEFKFKDIEDAYYEGFEKGYNCFYIKKVLNDLYKECEHGDDEHRKWLKDKFDDFYKRIVNE